MLILIKALKMKLENNFNLKYKSSGKWIWKNKRSIQKKNFSIICGNILVVITFFLFFRVIHDLFWWSFVFYFLKWKCYLKNINKSNKATTNCVSCDVFPASAELWSMRVTEKLLKFSLTLIEHSSAPALCVSCA